MTDFQLPRDLRHIDMLAFEREGGVARGDPERRDFGEVRDDVLADAVREVFLLRIATHVGERQNANGQTLWRSHLGLLALVAVGRVHGEDTHRALDVLHRVLAQVLERARRLSRNLIAHRE